MGINKFVGALALTSAIVTGGCNDKCDSLLEKTYNGAMRLSPGEAAGMSDRDVKCFCKGVSKSSDLLPLEGDIYKLCFQGVTGIRDKALGALDQPKEENVGK